MPETAIAPSTSAVCTARDSARIAALYRLGRIQYPSLTIPEAAYRAHLERAYRTYAAKLEGPAIAWGAFLESLYAFDWFVTCGCAEGLDAAWEILFNTRTGRSDCLLLDALRARACRLYPRDDEKQESAVAEFWSHLIVPDAEGRTPTLLRYDGQRPLAPWLIRVFQNWHLSKLRKHSGATAMPDDDLAMELPSKTKTETRWHEAFCTAAREWLSNMADGERLLLGLRWRYRMSQRDVAALLGVHEGTISRQTDKLRDGALESIRVKLIAEGWTEDDLEGYILTEMGGLMLDDPRLSADQLGRLLHAKGKALPAG